MSILAGYLIPLGITALVLAVLWRPILRDIRAARLFDLSFRGLQHPYADREWHRRFALKHGLFWKPCPQCGEHFGGHEVLNPTLGPSDTALCPTCTLDLPRHTSSR